MPWLVGPARIGPPVEWNVCLKCRNEMRPDEERYRIEMNGKVGVGHGGCQKPHRSL
jgi:hypothetical protein